MKEKRISNFSGILNEIKIIIQRARYNSLLSINKEILRAYFDVGKKIVEEEQKGKKRAQYGKNLLNLLSEELQKEFGRGFDASNLRRMRKFYLTYQKWETVSPKLSWSHYCEIIKIKKDIKRHYFERYAISEGLSVRDLKRQINSLYYERLIANNGQTSELSESKELIPIQIEETIKDPYILEFLNLEGKKFSEKELEDRILDNLQKFLLELGQGFSFVARQKMFKLDNKEFFIDLLFYNIYLKCYVIIDLKADKFKHKDIGQINLYLNYIKKEFNKDGDNEPVGIILCADKNKVQVEFALAGITNRLFVSRYKLYLPSKEELKKEIKKTL